MRLCKIAAASLLVLTICAASSYAKKKSDKQLYAMGVSISFSDTIVYFTDVQPLPSAGIDKDKFLVRRDEYSNQLQTYLESLDNARTHTCITYFGDNKEKLQKKAAKLTKQYMAKSKVALRHLSKNEFAYTKLEDYDAE